MTPRSLLLSQGKALARVLLITEHLVNGLLISWQKALVIIGKLSSGVVGSGSWYVLGFHAEHGEFGEFGL